MSEEDKVRELGRRKFLATGLNAGLGAAMLGAGARQAPAKEISLLDGIPAREFGKTGHRLPVLAFGGSTMVEKWADAHGVPKLPFDKRVEMVRHGYEKGIRYFDTSRNYGRSEAIMGEALKDVRDNVYLASKVGVAGDDTGILTRDRVRSSLETTLKELQTDHLDCVQIHGPAFQYFGYDRAMEIYEELDKMRSEKLFRYIGVTSHTVFEIMFKLIDTGLFDQALMAYGYFPKGMDMLLSHANMEWRQMCLSRARELGMPVLAMKTLAGSLFGHNAKALVPDFDEARLRGLRQAALRWVLSDDRITTLLVGVSMPSDIDANVETMKGNLSPTDQDRRVLAEFTAKAFRSKHVKAMKIT